MCVSETWLLPHTPDNFVCIPNYKIFRLDNGRGAGTCIYINDTLKVNQIHTDIPRPPGIEDTWITVQCRKLPSIIIGCMYRHPKALAGTFDYIEDIFRSMSVRGKPVFILGDFNDNLFLKGNKLSKIIKSYKLTQIIDKPTRITPASATLLDLVITNKPEMILSHDVVPQVVADHELVSINVDISKPKRKPVIRTLRHLGNYNQDKFCSLLRNSSPDMYKIFLTDNVEQQVEIFNSVFIKCLDECAPTLTKVIRRPFAPWMTEDLRNAIQVRNNKQKELKKDRNNLSLLEAYKTEKKRVTSLIRKAQSSYYNKQFSDNKGNIAVIWKLLREIVPNSKRKSNHDSFDNVNDMVEKFNIHFSNVGKTTYQNTQKEIHGEKVSAPPLINLPVQNQYFRPQPVDINTIILTVKDLKETTSVGSDNIPLKFVKDALYVIAVYLTCIVNTSIVTGVFPNAWKHAIIVPIFKNGDPENVNDYRPISILPVISKILEKIVANQLINYLEMNNLLSNTQHGFRPRLSTETALTAVTDEIYNNIECKKITLLTLCDLSKAFDSVHHKILLNKCVKLKIDPFWFQSYLSHRTQSVRIRNSLSRLQDINEYGVPQGSILGPILFNIFVNDLSENIKDSLVVQYADDTQFLHSSSVYEIKTLISKIEETLNNMKKYFLANGLMLNSGKTKCILIGNRQLLSHAPSNIVIKIGDETITPCNYVKNLGVYIDRFMLFDEHMSEISKKVMGTLMYLNRISDKLDRPTRVIAVQSLVLSIITYCIRIWGTTNQTVISRAQKLHNFAAKVAKGNAKKYDHATPIIQELGWLKISEKHKFDTCTTVFKVLSGFYPSWYKYFPTVHEVTESNTRQLSSLYVPKTRTDAGARKMDVLGPKMWNNLPSNFSEVGTVSSFKNKLLNLLLINPSVT